jgi:hypothetical protein
MSVLTKLLYRTRVYFTILYVQVSRYNDLTMTRHPTASQLTARAEVFYQDWNFRICSGAVHGKNIRVINADNSESPSL